MVKNFSIVAHDLRGTNRTTSGITGNIPICCLSPYTSLLLDARSCNDSMRFLAAIRGDLQTMANAVLLCSLYQMLLLVMLLLVASFCSNSSPLYNAKSQTLDQSFGTSKFKKMFGLTIKDLKKEEFIQTAQSPLLTDFHCMST